MKRIIFISYALFLSSVVFANGDPTDRISALIGSGNPTPRKITDIQIVSEKLFIRLGYYSEYTVRYVLWNNSDINYTGIDYAFPVDYLGGGEEYVNSGLIDDTYSESSYTIGWHDDYVKSISFRINGDELPYKRSEEVILKMPEKIKKSDYFPDEASLQKLSESEKKETLESAQWEYEEALKWSKIPESSRRWFYTKFSIKAHQAITLEVHYALRNSQTISTYSNPFESQSYCKLSYDFSPAQYWGDGKAWDFLVEIDASELAVIPGYYENEKYISVGSGSPGISVQGLPFKRKDNLYTYNTQNFFFKNATPLTVVYSLINNIPLPDLLNMRIPNRQYTFSASSEQKNYPLSNLNDMNMATAWIISGQKGMGNKLIIQFKEPTDVSTMILINGYHKNAETYLENNRIQKMDITVKGKINQEYMNNDGKWENRIDDYEHSLELTCTSNDNFMPISFEHLKQHPDVSSVSITESSFDKFKVTQIELTISEIYQGTKYDDTCISEIILLGKENNRH